uniref:capsid/nuclear shuttle family protein n=1 Tax=Flavobacterium sp. TaxID=239 RepID=UPI00404865EA
MEKKFIDVQTIYNAWNVSRTYIVLLNGVATGTDYNTRIGREITMTSYYHRMFITDATNIQQVRCMLVYDKQPAGALPAITDILQYSDANSPNNLNNRDRFVVVSDKVYTTSPQGVEIKFVKKYKKLRTITTYNNTGNGITDIATGALYFVAFAFNNVATT